MMLGKEIRLNRLLNAQSGKLLAITVDHAMARGVLRNLENITDTIARVASGNPDSMTMHKGIAESCFHPYAGQVGLILKCTTFSPYQPNYDTWVTDVEEAVRLGADAVSVGCIVGGADQPDQLRTLGRVAKEAYSAGMPLVAHIYPRGEMVDDPYDWKAVQYAARVGAELGVDIIKTSYTGSPETFAKVVEACPARVVAAGGEAGETIEDYFKMTRDLMDAGAAGVTYGRFVWQSENPGAVVEALKVIIHQDGTADQALEVFHRKVAAA